MRRGRPPHPPIPPEGPELDVVQQWFQAVISHPGGVASGLGSEDAQRRLPLAPEELGTVVAPSRNLLGIKRKEPMVLPGVAQPAIQEGQYVARLIRRRVLGLQPPPPVWYPPPPRPWGPWWRPWRPYWW